MSTSRHNRSFPWFRTIGLVVLLLLIGGLTWYWVWSAHSARKLNDALAALRAAGEPVTAAELAEPHVPDERNAAILLRKAARMIDEKSAAWDAYEKLEFTDAGAMFPLTDDEATVLARVVDENKDVFPIVESATKLDGVDWQIDYGVGMLNLNLHDLGEQRRLARLLRAAAILAHARGDDARAVEYAEQIGFVSRAVATQPTLVSSLVSIGSGALRTRLLAEMAPSLRVGVDDPRAVPPQHLRQIIDDLLDDGRARRALRHGMRGERAFQQDMMRDLLEGRLSAVSVAPVQPQRPPPLGSGIAAAVMAPVMRDNALLLVQHMNKIIASLDATDWPAYHARVPDEPAELQGRPVRYLYASILLPSLSRAPHMCYHFNADARLTAVALAMRWYRLEHDERLPNALEDLVPKYLPQVPPDVLAGGGRTIGYVRDGDRPRVYHVGRNGTDDGGREPDLNATKRQNELASDEVVLLSHQPRPATRPGGDE